MKLVGVYVEQSGLWLVAEYFVRSAQSSDEVKKIKRFSVEKWCTDRLANSWWNVLTESSTTCLDQSESKACVTDRFSEEERKYCWTHRNRVKSSFEERNFLDRRCREKAVFSSITVALVTRARFSTSVVYLFSLYLRQVCKYGQENWTEPLRWMKLICQLRGSAWYRSRAMCPLAIIVFKKVVTSVLIAHRDFRLFCNCSSWRHQSRCRSDGWFDPGAARSFRLYHTGLAIDGRSYLGQRSCRSARGYQIDQWTWCSPCQLYWTDVHGWFTWERNGEKIDLCEDGRSTEWNEMH